MFNRLSHIALWIFLLYYFYPDAWSQGRINLDNHARFETARILNEDRIHQMFEDPLGFIWILSTKGTFRFDGIKLTKMTGYMSSGFVTHDSTEIIFCSLNNLLKFNILSEQFDTLRVFPETTKIQINKGIQFDDSTYIYASNLLIRHETNTNTFHKDSIRNSEGRLLKFISLARDTQMDSIIWAGTTKNGFVRYDMRDGSYQHITLNCPEPEIREGTNTITKIFSYQDYLYLGTWYGGFFKYDKRDGSYAQYFVQDKTFNDGNNSFDLILNLIKVDSTLWISSYKGFMIMDLATDSILYHKTNGNDGQFFENPPRLIDSKKRVWMGIYAGIRLVDTLRTQFEILTNPYFDNSLWEIPFHMVQSKDGQMIYFCNLSGRGIYAFNRDDNSWQLHRPEIPTPYSVFKGFEMKLDKDTLWILENSNLYYKTKTADHLTLVDINYGSINQRFNHFDRLPNGNFVLLTPFHGAYEIDPYDKTITQIFEDVAEQYPEIKNFRGDKVHIDQDQNLWLCWKNYIFIQTKDSIIHCAPHLNDGKDIINVHDIFETDKKIWISIEDGIFTVEKAVLPKLQITKVSDINADDIVVDHDGIIWCNTPKIYRIDPTTKEATVYGINDGTHDPGRFGFEQVDMIGGKLIIGSRGKYSIFDPSKLIKNQETPNPYISNVFINGIDYKSDTSIMHRKQLNLKSFQNDIKFDFSAVAYTKPLSVKFRYRLIKDEDSNWSETGINNASVNFSELNGGEYIFQLQARNDNGIWSPVKDLDISIVIPFFKRKSTWITGLFLLIMLIYGGYRRRIKNLKNKAALQNEMHELERKALKAQMDPHFVFNALNSIQSLITTGQERKSILYLNKFSKLLRGILIKSQKTTSTLSEEIKVIENYLELEFLRLGDQYSYSIQVDDSIAEEDIEVQGLLFQPIVENAIHHGLAPKITGGHLIIKLQDKEDFILCTIEDNGVGRQRAKELDSRKDHFSSGMKLVAESIAIQSSMAAKDVIQITDLYTEHNKPAGTRVEIRIPIKSIAI